MPRCAALNVVIGVLNQAQQDVFHILADVARLGEAGRVRDGKGHVQDLRQRLGEEGLAAAGRADHDDVALLQLHVAALVFGALMRL